MGSVCLQPEGLERKTPDVIFVRPRQARLLHSGPAKIVTLTLKEIERIITQLCASRSKAEFVRERESLFADYTNLSFILANTFSMPENRSLRQAAVQQSLKNVKELFGAKGPSYIGVAASQEAVFSIETLRRAYRLVGSVHELGDVTEADAEKDQKLAGQFNFSALWCQLHLDCLRFVITHRASLNQESLDEILKGSRAAVRAYAAVRQGLALRIPPTEPLLAAVQPDEEDAELTHQSFLDLESSLDGQP